MSLEFIIILFLLLSIAAVGTFLYFVFRRRNDSILPHLDTISQKQRNKKNRFGRDKGTEKDEPTPTKFQSLETPDVQDKKLKEESDTTEQEKSDVELLDERTPEVVPGAQHIKKSETQKTDSERSDKPDEDINGKNQNATSVEPTFSTEEIEAPKHLTSSDDEPQAQRIDSNVELKEAKNTVKSESQDEEDVVQLKQSDEEEVTETDSKQDDKTDIEAIEQTKLELDESTFQRLGSEEETRETPKTSHEIDEISSSSEKNERGKKTNSLEKASRKKKKRRRKKPRKYKGLNRAVPKSEKSANQISSSQNEESKRYNYPLPIDVHLRFDRGNFCNISLIAKRSTNLPEEITVATPEGELDLRALQDEWYDFIELDDIPHVLKEGAVWTAQEENESYTWTLSGRDLYVLGARSDISGYVSQPCLELGRNHVVICRNSIKDRVEAEIYSTGAQPEVVNNEAFGVPMGWTLFKKVIPQTPVESTKGEDLFNALKPLPPIEISLEQGICLDYTNWLEDYPPSIRINGESQYIDEVLIDGKVALQNEKGFYKILGWDSVGDHTIWCAGKSRSYSIVPFEASWEIWDAHTFTSKTASSRNIAICGPIARASPVKPIDIHTSIPVPESNPLILGQKPGQVEMAERVSSIHGINRIATPSFRPVWALPRDPLHSDKREISILFLSVSDASVQPIKPKGDLGSCIDPDVERWYRLILDSNRKGLRLKPDTEEIRSLWNSYKKLARRIWRANK